MQVSVCGFFPCVSPPGSVHPLTRCFVFLHSVLEDRKRQTDEKDREEGLDGNWGMEMEILQGAQLVPYRCR